MMIEQDTIRLLRECDAGIQMGVSAIDDVLERRTGPGHVPPSVCLQARPREP